MKVTKEYVKILKERTDYFSSKTVTELDEDEIQEYLNLKKELSVVFKDFTDMFIGAVSEMVEVLRETPEFQAQLKYNERVKERK